MENSIILEHNQIVNKARRIAFQILETNVNEKEIVLAGIKGNGFIFASLLKDFLNEISSTTITLCEVVIDKKNPRKEITTSLEPNAYKNKALVLVDDVLNSGSTLIYGVKHFLEVPLKNFTTAVLVNRNHKKFPVKADFKGLSLSTSLHEHVEVVFEKNNFHAKLT